MIPSSADQIKISLEKVKELYFAYLQGYTDSGLPVDYRRTKFRDWLNKCHPDLMFPMTYELQAWLDEFLKK